MKKLLDWLFGKKSNRESGEFGLLILRLFFGLPLSIRHGWPTLWDWCQGKIDYPDPLGLGQNLTMLFMGSIEAICTLLVVIGLFTRLAAFFVASGFIVAVLVVHANDAFGVKELAYMYMSGFLAIFFLGPGRFSLDYFRLNGR